MEGKGYALFFVPELKHFMGLNQLIYKLGEEYSTKTLLPHITLLDRLHEPESELIKKTYALSNSLKPFEIKLSGLNHSKDYFKGIFIEIEKTKELIEANEIAKRIFKKKGEFDPYLTLLYGEFPEKKRKKIISKIKENSGILDKNLRVMGFHLFQTNGEIDNWKRKREFFM